MDKFQLVDTGSKDGLSTQDWITAAFLTNGGMFGGNRNNVDVNADLRQLDEKVTNAALSSCKGFSDTNFNVSNQHATSNQIMTQGFSGLNTAIVSGSYEDRLANMNQTFQLGAAINGLGTQTSAQYAALQAAMSDKCCHLEKTVLSENAATRELIQANELSRTQVALCDKKDEVHALQTRIALMESQAGQSAAFDAKLAAMTSTIIHHVK